MLIKLFPHLQSRHHVEENEVIKMDDCEYLNVLFREFIQEQNWKETPKVSNLKLFFPFDKDFMLLAIFITKK